MNPERAETYLRLLAEAETREPTGPVFAMPWSGGLAPGTTCRKLQVVAQSLTAMGALDEKTAEAILADFDLAVSARQLHRGREWRAGGVSGPLIQAAASRVQLKARHPLAAGSLPPPPGRRVHRGPAMAAAGRPAARVPASPGPQEPGEGGPECFVPLGLTIPFRAWGASGGLYLMSYARTAAGARFTVAWREHGPFSLDAPVLGNCTVTDDRGGRYQVDFTGTSSGPDWTGVLSLDPCPPGDLRWLDFGSPSGTAVRVALDAAGSDGAHAQTSQTSQTIKAGLDPGEHLLTLIAERLLYDLRMCRNGLQAEPPGRFSNLATGLGDVVAALEAAEILAADSPVPGRLATLCANLRIEEPELAARPAHDLPEHWLSLLAHYLRRKPDTAPARDGAAAALAGRLPDLDGIGLALLGMNNAEKTTFVHLLASGLPPDVRHGPFGIGTHFPLSVWLRDDGGRWHLAWPGGRHRLGADDILRLRLTPPLTRATEWIEVLAAGRSAQVRARLPLRWENPL
jgi:hypothetical protein